MGSRTAFSARRIAVLRLLAFMTASFAVLAVGRVLYTGTTEPTFLAWNVFLAWIPFALAVLVYDGHRRGRPAPALLAGVALWLLFLPNAPYIVTDFKWLDDLGGIPVWYDAVLLSSAAATGLALGFVSLYLMQVLAQRVLGVAASRIFVVAVLALSSFGVYLGRVLRWNSWDLFTQPASRLGDLAGGLVDPFAHTRLLAATVLATALLTAAYAAFYHVTHPRLRADLE